MKRLLCLFLSLIITFSFSACNKKDNKNKNIIDMEYYVNLGKIPECEYSIGQNVEKLKDELSNNADEHSYYDFKEDDDYSSIDNGTYRFYFKNNAEDKGVSYIVSFAKAYEMEIGNVSIQLKEAFPNVEFKEENLTKKNSFFMFGSPNGTLYKAEFGEYTVAFVFVENALVATALYTTSEWE